MPITFPVAPGQVWTNDQWNEFFATAGGSGDVAGETAARIAADINEAATRTAALASETGARTTALAAQAANTDVLSTALDSTSGRLVITQQALATTTTDVTTAKTDITVLQAADALKQADLTAHTEALNALSALAAALQLQTTANANRLLVLEAATSPPAVSLAVATFTLGATTTTTQVGNWTAPASGPAPTGYQMQYKIAGAATWTPGPLVTAPTLTGTFTGLTAGTNYDFSVVSVNTAGPGGVSVIRTQQTTVATPNVVASFSLGATANTTQVATWTAPASGPTPTGYQMRYRLTGVTPWTNGPLITFPTLTGTFTGLTAGTPYDFSVVATNAAGAGVASATLSTTTTTTFTPSPAWTEITNNGAALTMDDGTVWTIVNSVAKRNGVDPPLGTTSFVTLMFKSNTGFAFQQSNAPGLEGQPDGHGYWFWDGTTPWQWAADPRPAAPGGLRNPNTIPFASDSVWNIGLGNSATWAAPGAAETITLRGTANFAVNGSGYGQPIRFPTANDPMVTFTCTGNGQSGPNLGGTQPWTRQFHCPADAQFAAGTDRHLNLVYGLEALSMCFCSYNNGLNVLGGVTCVLGSVIDLTKNGLLYPSEMNGTGDNYLAGTITPFDLSRGEILHMLRIAISPERMLKPNNNPGDQTGIEYPNTHGDFNHNTSYQGNLPVGTYGIPNSVNLNAIGLTTAGGMMLAKALQNFGCVWRDVGGTNQMTFYTTPENNDHPLIAGMRTDGNAIKAVMVRMTNQAQWGVAGAVPATSALNGGGTRRAVALAPVGIAAPPASTPRLQLLAYLDSISGNHILSGQMGHANDSEFNANTAALGFPLAIKVNDPWVDQWSTGYLYDTSFVANSIAHANSGGIIGVNLALPNPAGPYGSQGGNPVNAESLLTSGSALNLALKGFLNQAATDVLIPLQNAGKAVALRFLWELDGNWFWWSTINFSGSQQTRLYRLIREHFTITLGLTNLLFCFAVNGGPGTYQYPGDDLVDIIGPDVYTNTVTATYQNLYNQLRAQAPSKAFFFMEWGAGNAGANNPAYVTSQLFIEMEANFPRACGVIAWPGWGWYQETNPIAGLTRPSVINRAQVHLP